MGVMSNSYANEKLNSLGNVPKSVLKPDPCHRAWVEVDSKAIENNSRVLKNFIKKDCLLMAVVKADGYGHGAITVSKAALRGGADSLGVATLEEGIELRKAGLNCQILVLGNLINREELNTSFHWNLVPTISGIREAIICNNVAEGHSKKFVIHLKVDTGMTRLGCNLDEFSELVFKIDCLKNLSLEGIYSHLALADEDLEEKTFSKSFTQIQKNRFTNVLASLGERRKTLCCHLANSAGTLSDVRHHLDMVRVGLSLYGYYPKIDLRSKLHLKPALKVKARITFIRDVPSGTGVGYGHLFKTKRKTRLAVVAIGYADGVSRALSGKISGIVHGDLVPQVGAIAMDQMVLDITQNQNIKIGTGVTILGSEGKRSISPQEWGDLTGSIPWEILCGFKNRLPRVVI
tara:strand:+ start:233 stop:1444 length:1212 start_codon:yes stop_codon:yes gene_type:complete